MPVAGGKFHYDDHGVLRTKDDFLCTMMLRCYVMVMIPLSLAILLCWRHRRKVAKSSYSALTEVWIVG